MSTVAPQGTAPTGMGSLKRSNDPLDRMPVRGGEEEGPRAYGGGSGGGGGGGYDRREGGYERRDGDRAREERMKAMDKPQPVTQTPT